MTAAALLAELRRRGVELWAEGDRLGYRAPRGALTPELREAVAARKGELLELLRGGPARPAPAQEPGAAQGGPEPQAPLEVEGHRIKPWSNAGVREEIERRGWAVIYSRTLGEPVLWLRDSNVVVPGRWRRLVGYTLEELEALKGVTPDGLREIHAAKKVFGGTVLPPEEARRAKEALERKGGDGA